MPQIMLRILQSRMRYFRYKFKLLKLAFSLLFAFSALTYPVDCDNRVYLTNFIAEVCRNLNLFLFSERLIDINN